MERNGEGTLEITEGKINFYKFGNENYKFDTQVGAVCNFNGKELNIDTLKGIYVEIPLIPSLTQLSLRDAASIFIEIFQSLLYDDSNDLGENQEKFNNRYRSLIAEIEEEYLD